jgi:hypothetical protein
MKRRLYLYGSLIFSIGLLVFAMVNPVFYVPRTDQSTLVKADQYSLQHHVEILSAANPPRNFENLEALEAAADYVTTKIGEYGLVANKQGFTVGDKTYYNVVTHLGPSDGDALVIGAHYDSAHGTPGADDNASGTAGLIELARMLALKNDQLKRPIILVAYTLEEPPNFRTKNMGSFVHAQLMKDQGRPIKLMISLEMIGYFKDESGTQNYPVPGLSLIYPSKGNYISIVARPEDWMITSDIKSFFMSATDLPLYSANIPARVPGVDYSDHASYWQLGFPAVMITDTAFMRNPNYHEKTDLPSTLDYRRMSEVINGVYAIAIGL